MAKKQANKAKRKKQKDRARSARDGRADDGKNAKRSKLLNDEDEMHTRDEEEHADEPEGQEALSSEEDEGDDPEEPETMMGEGEDSDEPGDETNEGDPPVAPLISDGRYRNKQRCLVLCSRGVTARYRHLLEDIRTLLPHHKKDSKLDASRSDTGGYGRAVNEIADVKGCNSVVFLECRKRQDAYLWIGRTDASASGPSAKFHVSNVHTMDELRLTGNCMKGSRPVLTFDSSFDEVDHLKLLKCLFIDVFGTPRGHPKSKPFVDRVMGFYYADGKIWVRNYQILEQQASNAREAHLEKKATGTDHSTSLVEIGPRFVLDPIRIFRGSFGGQTLFVNSNFVSPNEVRAQAMREKGRTYGERKEAQAKRRSRKQDLVLPNDPLDSVFR